MAIEFTTRFMTRGAERDIRRFTKKAGSDIEKLKSKSVASSTAMTAGFGKLTTALGVTGLGFALRSATRLMTSFETAIAEVSTLVNTTVVDMGALSNEVLKLTTVIPRDAVDISKGLYQVISAGVTDASDALFVLEVASKAATAGLTDTNTAVKAITTILNSYQKNINEATNVSDVLFTTVRLGTLRFADIANSIGIASTSAALAGVTFEELSAALSTMTKFGIKTEISVTSLNRLFLQMVNPTTRLKEVSRELGIEFSAAALRSKGFAKFMAELTEKFSEDKEAIFALGLDLRAFRALAVLGGKGAEEFARQLLEMNDVLDASQVAFDKMNKTAAAQAQILKNKLNLEWQAFGRNILPPAVFVMKALSIAISPVNSMLEIQEARMRELTKATSSATPVLGGWATAMFFAAKAQAEFLKNKKDLEDHVKTIGELRVGALKDLADARAANLREEEKGLVFEDIPAPPMEEVIDGLGEAKTITEKWLELQESLNMKIGEAPPFIERITVEQQRALNLTRQLANAFGQAVAFSDDLLESVKDIAKQLAVRAFVAFITSGAGGFAQQFFGFAHGTSSAPGGPALVGERGPEIVNLPRGSQVIPNNQISNFSTNNSFTLVFPNIGVIDEFELRSNIIPKINELVQNKSIRLTASDIA